MSDHTDQIDAKSLRIQIDGKHAYRKDIINRSRRRWQTSNKSKAVMRSAESFVDLVDELEQLLKNQDVSDDLKRELVDQFDSKHLQLTYKLETGLNLDR